MKKGNNGHSAEVMDCLRRHAANGDHNAKVLLARNLERTPDEQTQAQRKWLDEYKRGLHQEMPLILRVKAFDRHWYTMVVSDYVEAVRLWEEIRTRDCLGARDVNGVVVTKGGLLMATIRYNGIVDIA